MQVAMAECRRRLAVIWFLGMGAVLLLQALQTIFGRYPGRAEEAWGWLLPHIMPTSSLIIGVLVVEVRGRDRDAAGTADQFFYRLTVALCLLYLGLLLLTFLIQPLVATPPLELMQLSNLWLGPVQGLVSAALAGFFLQSQGRESGSSPAPSAR